MQRFLRPQTVPGIILTLAACVAVAAPRARGQDQPAVAPQLDPVVDRILTRLENREVHDLRAAVRWELIDVIEEDEEGVNRKLGTIWYQQSDPVAKFKVHFDTKIVGNKKRSLNEDHLFDGRWYVELDAGTKTVTRREIRREGEKSDPYKLGEGAFPLPFGQKKADILAEFEVVRIPPAPGDPPATDHLRLTPRPDTNTGRTYKTLEFWIAQEGDQGGLPVKVVAGKKGGTGAIKTYITITFSKVELNSGFSDSVFKIEVPRGYEEIVERLDALEIPAEAGAAEGKPE